MSEVKVNKISPRTNCGTTTLGDSGDTFTIPAGVTITNNGTQTGFGRTGTVDWQTGDIKTSTFTAESGKGYFCNTAGGTFEVDLPAGTAGAIVSVQDYNNTFDTANLTVDPNGSEKINGGTAGGFVTLSTEGEGITLVYIDSTVGWRSIQDNVFADPGAVPTYIAATGGTITTVCTNFKVHTFTGPGTFTVCSVGNSAGSNTVDYMVIAGGASAGNDSGGGGGAGGYRESPGTASGSYTVSPLGVSPAAALPVSATGYPIVVGGGGAATPTGGGPACGVRGNPGNTSSFSSISSAGGGGGGTHPAGSGGNTGINGGSGGGGRGSVCGGSGNTPPVTPPQGKDGGGPGVVSNGGGGATAAGQNAPGPTQAGAGGAGATSSINGTPTGRAGGGGAGGSGCVTSGGASDGGGAGAHGSPNGPGTAGTVNTGGGGGGGTDDGSGAAGGSGIVIIRYKFQ